MGSAMSKLGSEVVKVDNLRITELQCHAFFPRKFDEELEWRSDIISDLSTESQAEVSKMAKSWQVEWELG